VNRHRLGKGHGVRLRDALHRSKIKILKASGGHRVSSSAILNQENSVNEVHHIGSVKISYRQ